MHGHVPQSQSIENELKAAKAANNNLTTFKQTIEYLLYKMNFNTSCEHFLLLRKVRENDIYQQSVVNGCLEIPYLVHYLKIFGTIVAVSNVYSIMVLWGGATFFSRIMLSSYFITIPWLLVSKHLLLTICWPCFFILIKIFILFWLGCKVVRFKPVD
ncbi:unnamed protein product [Didymodactylos carnosus]|uniref:Uncharacterized protein n=1 Tax=Didymodactylos carnosus TaxID=1234261 RepID=A0A815UXW4_9BILA|nr:unnamed protein product [Didymodactylos carnosus]CAF1522439.1 unnamed protein product [Didymodactylos carnosus]CAF3694328.1 unnamed protein product [Didymodactylos carnosus]CAF4381590.1 unnamed protein product [Didymodactylos carnosus]